MSILDLEKCGLRQLYERTLGGVITTIYHKKEHNQLIVKIEFEDSGTSNTPPKRRLLHLDVVNIDPTTTQR